MRVRSSLVVVTVLAVVPEVACETPRSVIEIPACADRVEIEGQATRLSSRRFELDHTFDLPFSRTEVTFAQKGAPRRRLDIVASEPDPVRFFLGAAAGAAGGLLIAGAVADAGAPADGGAVTEGAAGAGLVVLGVGAMATGWHPPARVHAVPGACVRPAVTRGVVAR